MGENIEILGNKVDFLANMAYKIGEKIGENFDFYMFIINNNLTSTHVVLIIKALTIMNYRRLNILNDNLYRFKDDDRFSDLLMDSKPTFDEFKNFVYSIGADVNTKELLVSLKNQEIGKNICEFLLESN